MTGDPELDELLREVDRLCAARNWSELVALRSRARASHERGRQHWPAAEYAEYRLALDAPGSFAAQVIVEEAGRFGLGPLTEVAASTHTWADLAPHLSPGPLSAIAAHERVIRGDDLTNDDRVDRSVLAVPLVLEEWETSYAPATYRVDKADFPMPDLPPLAPIDLPRAPHEHTTDVDEARALRGLAATWLAESNGQAFAVAVRGFALQAIAALDITTARTAPLTPGQAFAAMAWAGASGGANGRRRGMAWGRYLAWECASILLQIEIEDVGVHVDELDWFAWDAFDAQTGWALRLAVADPMNDCAWAVVATDQV
ncbi:MAG TPA: DUF6183 family protein [Acidimicrobiales bacterium]|jgi:hypothetical protein